MKKKLRIIILTSILFIGCLKFYGQNYKLTIGNTNSWKVVTGNLGFSTATYYTDSTTTQIDSLEFNNVYKSNNNIGFIKEDSVLKILYWTNDVITKSISLPIFILCDFSLQINDSIQLYDFSSIDIINLGYYNLDSIKFKSTQVGLLKFFFLTSKNFINGIKENPVWVEGVGPVGDLVHPGRSPKEQSFGALSCATKNNEQTFISQHAIDFGNCDIFVDVQVQELLINSIKIFPNPANEFLNISIGNNVTNKLFLSNNLGEIVISKIIKGTDRINLKNLDNGIYYLKILTDEQLIIKKIIIEN